MATVYPILLKAEGATLPASNFAAPLKIYGSAFPIERLLYDAATAESAYWIFRVNQYGSGNINIDIDWYAVNATSGSVVWGAQIGALTPDTDNQSIETKTLGTANTVTDAHLGSTSTRPQRCTIALSNLDSLAVGDLVVLRIYRDAANGSDDMANDAALVQAQLSWSDA